MADLIDRDALLLKQKAHADLFADSTVHDDIVRRDEATAALAEIINAPSASRWIPCSERLPEEGVKCLVCMSDKNILIAKWDGKYDKQGVWCIAIPSFGTKLFRIKNVPAWMPLPEPPKEADND